MNEALMSALPVFMTNISPNNAILPSQWLAESGQIDSFRTKSMVNVYDAKSDSLARIIDKYIKTNEKNEIKEFAYNIGINNFSVDSLKNKYLDIINK
jgi:hypothetical protein